MPDLQQGDVFAGHRIVGVAGRGGMGVVYRAVQLDLDRAVALKLIAAHLAEDVGFRERFVPSPALAASIDHPNVIPIYYTGEHEGALYIAMRYVDGLGPARRSSAPPAASTPARAVHIVAQVASALDAAHARGIVHRDVKPANVLLGDADHAYLTDFGLTKRIASSAGATRTEGGWVGHARLRRARADPRRARRRARRRLRARLRALPRRLGPARRTSATRDEATLWAHLQRPAARAGRPTRPPSCSR